jgi:diacylglycerol kinase family enzyme
LEAVRTHRFLLVNPRSGKHGPTADELAAAAGERGIEVHLLREGEDPYELAAGSGAEIIGVAGGDGSLAPVAAAAVEARAAFVCIPFGTRNHFARDVGLDRNDPLGALEAFDTGRERRIDVGSVGDRLFLNNVSLGVYAGLVHRRERHRRRGEALARLRALTVVARDRHLLRARVNGEDVTARVLLVGNNRYEVELFTVGVRDRLDEGVLQLRAAPGLLPTAWEERAGPGFRIELDGEPVVLEQSFEARSLPRALRLLVPGTIEEQSR